VTHQDWISYCINYTKTCRIR